MKKSLLGLVLALGLTVTGAWSQEVSAIDCPADTPGYGQSVNSLAECMLDPDDAPTEVTPVVKNILNVVLGIMGAVAVGVIILGGFYFLTSQGDAAKVTRGKNTILYGVVGLIIALLALVIVNFVMSNVFKSTAAPAGASEVEGGGA